MTTPNVVMIGHLVIEYIHFPDRVVGPVLGSPPAYASVTASRLGMRAGIVTLIGRDMPSALLRPLRDANVDLRGVRIEGERTTASRLIYQPLGAKEIRYLHQQRSICFADIPPAYHKAQAFHVCPMDWDMLPEDIAPLRRLGKLMSVDLGGYGGIHSPKHPMAAEQANPTALAHLVGHFDITRASVEDIHCLLGATPDQAAEVSHRFVGWGAQIGIVTLGAGGAVVTVGSDTFHVPALAGQVVDPTGGGDAFSAGFLVAYLRTGDAHYAARYATAVAFRVIQGTGGISVQRMPTHATVEDTLHQQARP